MKKIQTLTQAELTDLTKKGRVVLEFAADWCGDCRFLEPFLAEIEADFKDSQFYQIDRDGSIDLAKEMNILGIPSFVVYQDGKEIGRLVNGERKTKAQVEAFLRSID